VGTEVRVGFDTKEVAMTALVIWARVGLLVELRVAVAHGGAPLEKTGVGATGSQAPTPPSAAGLNHSRLLPPPRLQSVRVREVKELPVDRPTSKYWPVEVKVGAATGSDPYCATVMAPTPVLLAVAPSLVAVAVPAELEDAPPWELVEPVGAGGGVGAVALGAVTVSTKVQVPLSPSMSESVPLTE
jgi:hypothetical protein